MFNVTVQGWINYSGRFYRSMLHPLLRRSNDYLGQWAKRKYKRLHDNDRRARQWLVRVARVPALFRHHGTMVRVRSGASGVLVRPAWSHRLVATGREAQIEDWTRAAPLDCFQAGHLLEPHNGRRRPLRAVQHYLPERL